MVNEKVRKYIQRKYGEVLIFDNQAYDNSIIGFLFDEDTKHYRAVYSRKMMEEELAQELMETGEYESYDEAYTSAIEWIDYNTEGGGYSSELPRPLIFHEFIDEEVNYDTFIGDYERIDSLMNKLEVVDKDTIIDLIKKEELNGKISLVCFWLDNNGYDTDLLEEII